MVKKKTQYTFDEIVTLCIGLGLVKHTNTKGTRLDITQKFIDGFGQQHMSAMILHEELKKTEDGTYNVSDIMLANYIQSIIEKELQQKDNSELGNQLFNFFINFPRLKKLAQIVEHVNTLSADEAKTELKKLGVKLPKSTKEHISYIG